MNSTPNTVKLLNILDNPNFLLKSNIRHFSVYEHQKDLSAEANLMESYFMHHMSIRPRQLLINLNNETVKVQAGAMQWSTGDIESDTGLGTGGAAIGGFLKGAVKGLVTGESAVKPIYKGTGYLMLEPTYKHILLEEVSNWGDQGIVIQDGMFLAAESTLTEKLTARNGLGKLAGGEGLFNLSFLGSGLLALESPFPREELFEFELNNSVLKIDGNMAVAWSNSLDLTVERSSKGLIGSMVNKEGLLNVYRGTGKVLMAATAPGSFMENGTPKDVSKASGASVAKGILDSLT